MVTLGLTLPLGEKWTENKVVRSCKQGQVVLCLGLVKIVNSDLRKKEKRVALKETGTCSCSSGPSGEG